MKWQRIIVSILVAVSLFFFDRVGFFDSAVDLFNRAIISPLTRLTFGAGEGASFLFKNIFLIRSLISENISVKKERDFFRGEYFKLVQVQEENNFLRQALSLGKKEERKIVLGDILSFDPFLTSDSFLINKGAKDGVKISDPVILAGEVAVGRVKEVYDKESRVLLISSSQSRVTVALGSGDNAKGVVSGSASGALTLDLVLKGVDLRPGQILLTSGLDGVFPAGLLVGEISKISTDSAASFQKASVKPFFNLSDLKQVFILIGE